MSDFEILNQYIKERGLDKDMENLSFAEITIFKCCLRDTLSFNLYLARYRALEFFKKIAEQIKERD